ncbi:MAG TPA: Tex-like N-terminal domain-containing protein, partial [Gemmataceae bacterium]|nr:Tex-like N-terminal domain-containing protein [Gemmataceae bacterium]
MQTSSQPQAANSSVGQPPVTRLDFSRIAQDLQIRKVQVEAVVQLLDEGNTVPFITRYRKERTGCLNEDIIRTIQARVAQLRQLAERKQTVLKSIEGQGKLTEELRAAILAADNAKRLEDLYLPYKPKKRTLATTARERGLEPLALALWNADPAVANLAEVLPTVVNPEKELNAPEDVLLGVQHILAEQISETADIRAAVRTVLWDTGKFRTAKSDKVPEGEGLDFKDYFQFTEPIRHVPPHRVLAVNRGEKENVLTVRVECDPEQVQRVALEKLPLSSHPHAEFLKQVTADALARLVLPSLEREIRRELTSRAEQHAVTVFARNLRCLLLQPPLRGRKVLAVDPAFRTGCKVACLDELGNLLEDAIIYPHPPHPRPHGKKSTAPAAPAPPAAEGAVVPPEVKEESPPPVYRKREEAKAKLEELIRRHQINVIAIGNGTACRETEEVVSDVIAALEKGLPAGRLEPGAPGVPPTLATTVAAAPPACPPALTAQCSSDSPLTKPALQQPEIGTQYTVFSTEYSVLEMPSTDAPARSPDLATHYAAASQLPLETALPPLEANVLPSVFSTVYSASSASAAGAPPPDAAAPAASEPVAAQSLSAPMPPPPADLSYVIVNEAGASVYSASAVGREEFPNYDATLRGTISIGRRLQDPLSELVKIDPQNIGVGLYQHDV